MHIGLCACDSAAHDKQEPIRHGFRLVMIFSYWACMVGPVHGPGHALMVALLTDNLHSQTCHSLACRIDINPLQLLCSMRLFQHHEHRPGCYARPDNCAVYHIRRGWLKSGPLRRDRHFCGGAGAPLRRDITTSSVKLKISAWAREPFGGAREPLAI